MQDNLEVQGMQAIFSVHAGNLLFNVINPQINYG